MSASLGARHWKDQPSTTVELSYRYGSSSLQHGRSNAVLRLERFLRLGLAQWIERRNEESSIDQMLYQPYGNFTLTTATGRFSVHIAHHPGLNQTIAMSISLESLSAMSKSMPSASRAAAKGETRRIPQCRTAHQLAHRMLSDATMRTHHRPAIHHRT